MNLQTKVPAICNHAQSIGDDSHDQPPTNLGTAHDGTRNVRRRDVACYVSPPLCLKPSSGLSTLKAPKPQNDVVRP
jgi:hypothetical protein